MRKMFRVTAVLLALSLLVFFAASAFAAKGEKRAFGQIRHSPDFLSGQTVSGFASVSACGTLITSGGQRVSEGIKAQGSVQFATHLITR